MARPAVMLRQASSLVAFEEQLPEGVRLSAELIWSSDGWLELSYGILMPCSGGISDLVLPEGLIDGEQSAGQRRDHLWESTCCEAFLAIPGEERYWEINLSPNGDWAVYRFDRYRDGQHNQALNSPPVIRLKRRHHQLRLDARLPLSSWWPLGVCPELSLTTVLEDKTMGLSHWALRHEEGKADFHRRSTFLKP